MRSCASLQQQLCIPGLRNIGIVDKGYEAGRLLHLHLIRASAGVGGVLLLLLLLLSARHEWHGVKGARRGGLAKIELHIRRRNEATGRRCVALTPICPGATDPSISLPFPTGAYPLLPRFIPTTFVALALMLRPIIFSYWCLSFVYSLALAAFVSASSRFLRVMCCRSPCSSVASGIRQTGPDGGDASQACSPVILDFKAAR